MLILWDIDGTLIRAGSISTRAFDSALAHTYGLQPPVASVPLGGKTDPLIVMEKLAEHGIDQSTALAGLQSFMERYTAELSTFTEQLSQHVQVLPGVVSVLESFASPAIHQTLLTGNFQSTARIKLASVNLDRHFDFSKGAFGSDHHDRNRFVPIARRRASEALGYEYPIEQIVVVGDTPRDIACARAAGVRVVAVATGRFSAHELRSHAPDALLPSLEDVERAVATIGNG
ncbi:MAG: haloacid dehalogenase-like hydrolase [Chloroflexota bacterium]